MSIRTLAKLSALQKRCGLDTTLTVRLSRADRLRIERVARELGVPPSRLARAVLRRALIEERVGGGLLE